MQATAIAYPVHGSPARMNVGNQEIPEVEPNFFSMPGSSFNEDTVDMSSNFFTQLDSMIQAVKVESTALDSMRDKLKEVDNLRNQISAFTKRLLDADQSNLNLKSNLVKAQEAYAELKKQKAEVESNMVPLRQELNRTKDMLQKERSARQSLQQEIAMLRDQCGKLQQLNEQMDREVKTIPTINESNEILKNDLDKLRKRYKEEKLSMQKHIKHLEHQSRDVDGIKNEVRNLAMRLMEVSGNGGGNGVNNNVGNGGSNVQMNAMQLNPAVMNYNNSIAAGNAINLRGLNTNSTMQASNSSQYDYHSQDEDEDDDYSHDGHALGGDLDSEYDNNSFIDDNSQMMLGMNGSIDSSTGNNGGAPMMMMGNNNMGNTGISNGVGGKKKKKVVKKVGNNNNVNVNMMQTIQGGQQGGMQGSYSLPRIH